APSRDRGRSPPRPSETGLPRDGLRGKPGGRHAGGRPAAADLLTATPGAPRFCPWCGSPLGYRPHEHEPRIASLASAARARGAELPDLPEGIEDLPSGESFVGGCPRCRIVSHVVAHRAAEG